MGLRAELSGNGYQIADPDDAPTATTRKAAARWCEVRIGELLGPTTFGERNDRKPSAMTEGLGKDERHAFRLLAAHQAP
jgi:hypothetical protein